VVVGLTGSWIDRDGWNGPRKRKKRIEKKAPPDKKPVKDTGEDPNIYEPHSKDDLPSIIYSPIKCPYCKSKNAKVYSTKFPIRYHTCKNCGANFKSVEET